MRLYSNKRANTAITLLVFIALFLVGFALFSFIIHPNVDARVGDARFIEKGLQEEEVFKQRMFDESSLKIEKEFYDKTRDYPFKKMEISEFELNESGNLRIVRFVIEGDKVEVKLNDSLYLLEIFDDSKNEVYLNYLYRPNPVLEISLSSMGLHSFEDIERAVRECGSVKDGVEGCLNGKLLNFESKLVVEGSKRRIEFTTKREFLIGGLLRKISFTIPL